MFSLTLLQNHAVPISVIALFKKIKALISSHSQLATVLRNSSKLVSFSTFSLYQFHKSINTVFNADCIWIL